MELGQAAAKGTTLQRMFGIPFDFVIGLVAGTAYTNRYTISTGYNFLWELTQVSKRILATGVPDSSATPTLRDVNLNIRDELTSEDMFVSPIYLTMLAGDGRNQNILPRPYIFNGGTTITLTLTDVYGGAAGMHIQIAFIGYKIRMTK